MTYVKRRPGAPPGFFVCEAAGLRWLADADGARVVRVRAVGDDELVLERLVPAPATPAAADELGRGLARTHAAGAEAFGVTPPDWDGDGFFGPLDDPYPLPAGRFARWGEFYAACRVDQLRRLLAGTGFDDRLGRLSGRLADGAYDDGVGPARVHGDLWSGNVMWTRAGAVLIDPAAHGGHPITDLAMLALFGAPHLERVVAAYDEAAPLPDGWRDVVGLHQVYPVGMHVVLFGGGYAAQLDALLRRYA